MSTVHKVTAFAPATVANVAIGFDILGHAVEAIGDRVHLERTSAAGLVIADITGTVTDLPKLPHENTAGQALLSLLADHAPHLGLSMVIEKGIPLGSGLGGSAASAVAAVVAGNAFLEKPLSALELLKYAMKGEAVASGSVHVDNIAPSLFGGLVLTVGIDNPRTKQIPVPENVRCVLVHPHMFLSTKEARRILSKTVDMSDLIWQCANLAGFISACYTNDLAMIRDAFEDVVIERQRQVLIPGFAEVKKAAMDRGALGCSISGAGPTIFAWCLESDAAAIEAAMVGAFASHGLQSDHWISKIEPVGARVVARS
jgi:homoserine kinase